MPLSTYGMSLKPSPHPSRPQHAIGFDLSLLQEIPPFLLSPPHLQLLLLLFLTHDLQFGYSSLFLSSVSSRTGLSWSINRFKYPHSRVLIDKKEPKRWWWRRGFEQRFLGYVGTRANKTIVNFIVSLLCVNVCRFRVFFFCFFLFFFHFQKESEDEGRRLRCPIFLQISHSVLKETLTWVVNECVCGRPAARLKQAAILKEKLAVLAWD